MAFDRNNGGSIDYDEFLAEIRGKMNEQRQRLVQQAFNILDQGGDGVIDIEDIKAKYNARYHPDVKQGKRTEEEV